MRIKDRVSICACVTCCVVASLMTGCSSEAPAPSSPPARPTAVPPAPGPDPMAAIPEKSEPMQIREAASAPTSPAPARTIASDAVGPLRSVNERYSLIKNGHFVEWRETDPLPLYWTLGAALSPDKVLSSVRALEVPGTSFSHPIEQTWKGIDSDQRIIDVFGQTVAGLEPDT